MLTNFSKFSFFLFDALKCRVLYSRFEEWAGRGGGGSGWGRGGMSGVGSGWEVGVKGVRGP